MEERALFLIAERNISELKKLLLQMNAVDIAELFNDISEDMILVVYRILPKDIAADVFVEMDPDSQEQLIRRFSDKELKAVLDDIFLDDTVDIIEEMPANVVTRILSNSNPEMRSKINEVLQYPSDSAGSLMTIEYVDFKSDLTVGDAIEKIRKIGPNKETIYTCYVTDKTRKLLGVVTVKDLLLAKNNEMVGDIMQENVIFVETLEDEEVVANLFDKYSLLAMPVVDSEKRLVGIITVDDAIDVIREETSEDIEKMAGITPSDEESYFRISVFGHTKKRILWLLFMMFSATLTGLIITQYEEALSALLVSFIPMLMDTGGNCGAQSSAMVIRGLATGDIQSKDFLLVLRKEMGIAALVGLILAVANSFRIWLMSILFYNGNGGNWQVSLVVGITLIGAVILAKFLGCVLPMLAKKLKFDPAVMASPIITTIVDCGTVLLYFNIAVQFLKGTEYLM